jgi:hypothetical protein
MSTDGESLDDIVAVTPTPAVKIAGALSLGSGLIACVLALQAGALLEARGAYQLAEPTFLLLGAACLVGGYRLTRMRAGAALLCAVASGVLVLAALGWFVITLLGGVFVLLALGLVPLASVAAIASVASLKPVERASAARKRLRAQGLDAGL